MNAAQLQDAHMAGRVSLEDLNKARARWTYDERAAASFVYWYKTAGHWLHDTRAEALEDWKRHGIIGRLCWTEERDAILAPWLAEDPAPALLEKLRQN